MGPDNNNTITQRGRFSRRAFLRGGSLVAASAAAALGYQFYKAFNWEKAFSKDYYNISQIEEKDVDKLIDQSFNLNIMGSKVPFVTTKEALDEALLNQIVEYKNNGSNFNIIFESSNPQFIVPTEKELDVAYNFIVDKHVETGWRLFKMPDSPKKPEYVNMFVVDRRVSDQVNILSEWAYTISSGTKGRYNSFVNTRLEERGDVQNSAFWTEFAQTFSGARQMDLGNFIDRSDDRYQETFANEFGRAMASAVLGLSYEEYVAQNPTLKGNVPSGSIVLEPYRYELYMELYEALNSSN